MTTPLPAPLIHTLTAHLTSHHLPPSRTYLQTHILPTLRATTPLPALQKTVLFRLLASDITASLDTAQTPVFPADIHAPAHKERQVRGPLVVQVLDLEDIGRSRWSQIEGLEATARGEGTKGREVVRVVPESDGGQAAASSASATTPGPGAGAQGAGPHKLLLQDAAGTRVYGIEVAGVEGVGVGMGIGAKVLLRDVTVARGVVLLEPRNAQVLGGRIGVLDKAWREGRLERLKAAAGVTERGA